MKIIHTYQKLQKNKLHSTICNFNPPKVGWICPRSLSTTIENPILYASGLPHICETYFI